MEDMGIIQQIKSKIAGVGFKLFLWGNNLTDEQYWTEIYEQEKRHREPYPFEED